MSDPITRLNAALEGRYRIERQLGEGGMATVYRARDVRHNRHVALKVLKPELVAVVGTDRFLAEIETTASLQHPHILPLFDSGQADGFLFYVMPFVEGETLRERLDREHQLPVDEAVRIAIDVAEALHHAHTHGVVHRDVKPANILLHSGRPVIADFGIALAVGAAAGGRLTETGISLGTPHYMGPEQATGDAYLGPAADIYALGCVLYEMLVGEPPHTGSTPQAVLGGIIGTVPDPVTERRSSTPPNVEAAVARALEKLPADRFADAHRFAQALADPGYRNELRVVAAPDIPGAWRLVGLAGVLSTAVLLVVLALVMRPGPVHPTERFPDPFLSGQEPAGGLLPFDLSEDGSRLVYRGTDGRLWLREWDRVESNPLPTRGGVPRFSPDGSSILYLRDGRVTVRALESGVERTVAVGNIPAWERDDRIYFTRSGSLFSVAPDGSDEKRHTTAEEGLEHYMGAVLPGGRAALIVVRRPADESFEIHSLNLASGDHELLVPGYVLDLLDEKFLVWGVPEPEGLRVLASRFDPRTLALGEAVTVVERASAFRASGDKLLYASATGLQGARNLAELAWIEADGTVTEINAVVPFEVGPLGSNRYALSPDGGRVAVRALTEDGYDIWIFDLRTGRRSRLTSDPGMDRYPAWHPGGTSVSFLSDRGGNDDVWMRPVSGTSDPELLLDLDVGIEAAVWTPDSVLLVRADGDLLTFHPGGDAEPTLLLAGPFVSQPKISPDGRWIAHTSSESGRAEVYLRPYPDVASDRLQISVAGGSNPKWALDGRTLFYRGADQAVMRIGGAGSAGPPFTGETPVALFGAGPPWATRDFDVAPDARFLLARLNQAGAEEPESPSFVLITRLGAFLRALPAL